jgi:lipid kinase YegS
LFVIHGARAEQARVRDAIDWAGDQGHTVTTRLTWASGDATRFAAEGAAERADAVVAFGGDGTVNEVINGLSGSDTALGIVPLGTANDFARQAGIPDDTQAAVELILRRKPVRIDTAEMNGRRFLNVSTAGVGAEATAETPQDAKESLGPLAYAITGVRKLAGLDPIAARVVTADTTLEVKLLVLAVGNGRMTGGGTLLTPHASVNDGLLDVCVVAARPRAEFPRLAMRLRKGTHLGMQGVYYVQVPWARVETEEPVTVNVDGEPFAERVLEYRSRPKDLLVHLGRALR